MRGQPSEYLDAADLILLKEERRREAAGRLSPLERLAGRFVPRIRRLIGPGGVAYLQRLINYAGRPVGVTVDGLLRKMVWWFILLLPGVVAFVVRRLRGSPACSSRWWPSSCRSAGSPGWAGGGATSIDARPAGLPGHPGRHGERRHRVPGGHGPGDRPVRGGAEQRDPADPGPAGPRRQHPGGVLQHGAAHRVAGHAQLRHRVPAGRGAGRAAGRHAQPDRRRTCAGRAPSGCAGGRTRPRRGSPW